MNRDPIFKALADEEPSVLLDLLGRAYDERTVEQRALLEANVQRQEIRTGPRW